MPSVSASRTVSSVLASSTRMTSSTTVRSISAAVAASVFAALYAGSTTHTRFPAIMVRRLRPEPSGTRVLARLRHAPPAGGAPCGGRPLTPGLAVGYSSSALLRPLPTKALAAGCAAGMALATAGSWLRYALDGRAAIDTHRASFVLASAVAGAGLILAGVCALRLAPRAGALGFGALWRWALAAHALALPALPLT